MFNKNTERYLFIYCSLRFIYVVYVAAHYQDFA